MKGWLRATTLVAFAIFAMANLVNTLRKGGDFSVYLEAGHRFMARLPLYADSGVGAGVIGPPAQAVLFAPFAIVADVSTVAARLAWYGVNLVLLAAGIVWWTRALAPPLGLVLDRHGVPVDWLRLALPLVAILFPLQTNFEHQNLNVVLLAITGGAAWALASGRERRGGVLIGIAAALKAFPVLLALVLLVRRKGAALSAIVTAVAVTVAAAARYGIAGGIDVVAGWLALSAAGNWPIRGNNQSLFAMLARYFGPDGLSARGHLGREGHPFIYFGWLIAATLIVAIVACKFWRWRSVALAPSALAAAMIAAILIAPIAWDHYWTLLFPAFFVVWNARRPTWIRPAFYVAAVMTSGFTRLTVGAAGLTLARELSTLTCAGVLLLVALLAAIDRLDEAVEAT